MQQRARRGRRRRMRGPGLLLRPPMYRISMAQRTTFMAKRSFKERKLTLPPLYTKCLSVCLSVCVLNFSHCSQMHIKVYLFLFFSDTASLSRGNDIPDTSSSTLPHPSLHLLFLRLFILFSIFRVRKAVTAIQEIFQCTRVTEC